MTEIEFSFWVETAIQQKGHFSQKLNETSNHLAKTVFLPNNSIIWPTPTTDRGRTQLYCAWGHNPQSRWGGKSIFLEYRHKSWPLQCYKKLELYRCGGFNFMGVKCLSVSKQPENSIYVPTYV